MISFPFSFLFSDSFPISDSFAYVSDFRMFPFSEWVRIADVMMIRMGAYPHEVMFRRITTGVEPEGEGEAPSE